MLKMATLNNILSTIETIQEAIIFINNTNKDVGVILDDIDNAVFSIRNVLKESLNNSEFLKYEKKFSNIKKSNTEKIIKEISEIKVILETRVDLCKQIVFMPYNASMWDCLESIWLAAKQDEECEVYVVPIPYCERRADGSFGKWYCEKDKFSKNIDIIDYQEYSVEENKPDIIYVHNPYDGYNRVTSVHPQYYSNELKKHTKNLVYIPYFVVASELPHQFSYMPSYENYDFIIVQNDNIKRFFDDRIRNKVIALGSPKIDKIVNYNKENKGTVIPFDWKNIIRNKKVYFLNFSISGMLNNGIIAIRKMNKIFEVFQKSDDKVLLFRPHPLLKNTLNSMRPDLLEEYLKLEQKIIASNFAILDTTADITSAIMISDVYIGEDTSSVIQLFGATGKEIIVLDFNVRYSDNQNEKDTLIIGDIAIKDNYIYFVPEQLNSICKLNLKNKKVEIECNLPEQIAETYGKISNLFFVENNLILTPYNYKNIYRYDIKNKLIKSTSLNFADKNNLLGYVKYDNFIFFQPNLYPGIVRYDTRDGSIEIFEEPIKHFICPKNHQYFYEGMFLSCCAKRRNIMLLVSAKDDRVLEFNMDNSEYKIYSLGIGNDGFLSMDFDGDDYWLIPIRGAYIVQWKYKEKEVIIYNDLPSGFDKNCINFYMNIVCFEKEILIFPREANMILAIDKEKRTISKADFKFDFDIKKFKNEYFENKTRFYFVKKYDDKKLIALVAYDNSIVMINVETKKVEKIECKIKNISSLNSESFKKGFCNFKGYYYGIRENIYLTAIDYLNGGKIIKDHCYKEQKKIFRDILGNVDGNVGETIHKYIKSF